jgi:uncharacterized protein (TIGR02569 family)
MAPHPPPSVFAAFGVPADFATLSGGLEPVFLAGDVVLKRADDPDEVSWKSELLTGLVEAGFRVARPVSATDGQWIVEGWMASRHVEGQQDPNRLAELLAAGRSFHAALLDVPRPSFLDRITHRWARAHGVVWNDATVEPVGPVGSRLQLLQDMRRPVHSSPQVIHADLAGNVLFAAGAAPAVLDFSPWWGPVGYAEGILLADALLFFDADPDSLALIADRPEFVQMLVRAVIFRLVALNEGAKEGHPEFLERIGRFDTLIAVLRRLLEP